jgi:hypothetical protein
MKLASPTTTKLLGLSAQLVATLRKNSMTATTKNVGTMPYDVVIDSPPPPGQQPQQQQHVDVEVGHLSKQYDAVEFPRYLPTDLQPGILHVGAGNFFRSHLATYMHDLLNTNDDDMQRFHQNRRWGIVGCGVRGDCFEKRKLIENQVRSLSIIQHPLKSLDRNSMDT